MFIKITDVVDAALLQEGTGGAGKISGYTYSALVNALGDPTYSTPSGDNKVQKEWVFKDKNGNGFTIYDWKTYNVEYTTSALANWNIGSKVDVSNFIEWLKSKLDSNKK